MTQTKESDGLRQQLDVQLHRLGDITVMKDDLAQEEQQLRINIANTRQAIRAALQREKDAAPPSPRDTPPNGRAPTPTDADNERPNAW